MLIWICPIKVNKSESLNYRMPNLFLMGPSMASVIVSDKVRYISESIHNSSIHCYWSSRILSYLRMFLIIYSILFYRKMCSHFVSSRFSGYLKCQLCYNIIFLLRYLYNLRPLNLMTIFHSCLFGICTGFIFSILTQATYKLTIDAITHQFSNYDMVN